jgi:hypothetical protein
LSGESNPAGDAGNRGATRSFLRHLRTHPMPHKGFPLATDPALRACVVYDVRRAVETTRQELHARCAACAVARARGSARWASGAGGPWRDIPGPLDPPR